MTTLTMRIKIEYDGLVNLSLNKIPKDVIRCGKFLDPEIGGGQFVGEIERRKREMGVSDKEIHKTVFGYASNKIQLAYVKNKYKLKGTYKVVDFISEEKMPKFDVIVGNPPFTSDKSKTENGKARPKQLYTEFVYKSLELANEVVMVLPSGWAPKNSAIKTKLINHGLKEIHECSKQFSINMDTCYIYAKKGYDGSLKVVNCNGEEYCIENVTKDTPIHLNASMNDIEKLDGYREGQTMADDWIHAELKRNDKRIHENGKTPFVDITNRGDELKIKYADVDESEFPGFDSWRVICNMTHGDYKTIGKTQIVEPGYGTSVGVVAFVCESKKDAEQTKQWMDSVEFNKIVASIKTVQHNTKTMFENIPRYNPKI